MKNQKKNNSHLYQVRVKINNIVRLKQLKNEEDQIWIAGFNRVITFKYDGRTND